MDGARAVRELFPNENGKYTAALIDMAVTLAGAKIDDPDALNKIGGGWVAEEALAAALYCAVKYSGDFAKSVVAAVNHDGDSDSTGAIAGNIAGASLGYGKIPARYLERLELRDYILELAEDIFLQCRWGEYDAVTPEARTWFDKYIYANYPYGDAAQS